VNIVFTSDTNLQRRVQDRVAPFRVVLALPRFLIGQVLVGRLRDPA